MWAQVWKAANWLGPSRFRQPIIKSLACFLLAAIVLQYSGILLLTHRYTMSRFYDVMLLVTNSSTNGTGTRRSLLQGIADKGHVLAERSKQKHFIAQYLQPLKVTDVPSSKQEGIYENNYDERRTNIYKSTGEKSHNVPQINRPRDEQKQEENDLSDKNLNVHVIVTKRPPPQADRGQQTSFMLQFWNIYNKVKYGLNPTFRPPTTTPQPACKLKVQELDGPLSVIFSPPEWIELEKHHVEVEAGGHWSPSDCSPLHKVALVIPFRDRDLHLRVFLQHIHPFLQKQLLDYTIFVVEQTTDSEFNRAMLMNIGFVEGEKLSGFDCYIFHDVDLLPETLQNLYNCPHLPRHMSAAVDSFGYRLPYHGIFGGVSAMKAEHFRRVNGFSNCFFGWGGEDDDMYNRIKHHGLDITRYPLHVARYRMISHKKQNPSNERFRMLNTGPLRFESDGLSSLKYERVLLEKRHLYTLIKVRINKGDIVPRDGPIERRSTVPPPRGSQLEEKLARAGQLNVVKIKQKKATHHEALTDNGPDRPIFDIHVKQAGGRRKPGSNSKLDDIEVRLNQVLHINGDDTRSLSDHKIVPQNPLSPKALKPLLEKDWKRISNKNSLNEVL